MWKLLQIWCLDKVFADRLKSSFDNLRMYSCFPPSGCGEKYLWDTTYINPTQWTLYWNIAVRFPSLTSYSAGDEEKQWLAQLSKMI